MRIKIRLSSLLTLYIAIMTTLMFCGVGKASVFEDEIFAEEAQAMQKQPQPEPKPVTPLVTAPPQQQQQQPQMERKVTEDVLANSIKAEYPADKWKVVPKEEVCIPPSPCGKKKEEVTTTTLHEKMKYECPPCRKCVKEIGQIKKLKGDIADYLAEIERLKKELADAKDALAAEKARAPQVQLKETRVEVAAEEKKNFLYFSPMYTQDGVIATQQDQEYVYEVQPVERLMLGGGYTRFFEWSKGLDLGLGIGGYLGENNYAVDAQIGVKF